MDQAGEEEINIKEYGTGGKDCPSERNAGERPRTRAGARFVCSRE